MELQKALLQSFASKNVGTWKYYTHDGITIEKQWPFRTNP